MNVKEPWGPYLRYARSFGALLTSSPTCKMIIVTERVKGNLLYKYLRDPLTFLKTELAVRTLCMTLLMLRAFVARQSASSLL